MHYQTKDIRFVYCPTSVRWSTCGLVSVSSCLCCSLTFPLSFLWVSGELFLQQSPGKQAGINSWESRQQEQSEKRQTERKRWGKKIQWASTQGKSLNLRITWKRKKGRESQKAWNIGCYHYRINGFYCQVCQSYPYLKWMNYIYSYIYLLNFYFYCTFESYLHFVT